MNKTLECCHLQPRAPARFVHRVAWLWRRFLAHRQIDPQTMSPHMLRDIGLSDPRIENPLSQEKLRWFI